MTHTPEQMAERTVKSVLKSSAYLPDFEVENLARRINKCFADIILSKRQATVEACVAALTLSADEIRLHCGEVAPATIRTMQALLRYLSVHLRTQLGSQG